VCDGCELVKAPAKKIAHASSQSEINQSKHTQILCNLADSTGANPKRAMSSVKHSPELFRLQVEGRAAENQDATPRIFATQDFAFCNSLVAPPFDSAREFLANSKRR
jgi:hypothetical protein